MLRAVEKKQLFAVSSHHYHVANVTLPSLWGLSQLIRSWVCARKEIPRLSIRVQTPFISEFGSYFNTRMGNSKSFETGEISAWKIG